MNGCVYEIAFCTAVSNTGSLQMTLTDGQMKHLGHEIPPPPKKKNPATQTSPVVNTCLEEGGILL